MDQAAHAVEIPLHPLGIDEQFVDHSGEAGEGEIERHRRVRADVALDRAVADVALVPQRDILQRRVHIGADHPGEAGQILGQHRVALVRHRRAALLAGREIFLGLEHLGPLQVADLGREPLDRGGDDSERGEEHGVAVARDDLGRDRLDPEAQLGGDMGLDPRVDIGEGADRARDGAGRDLVARRDHPGPRPGELGISVSELEPEGDRLGMDAVASADRRRQLMLERAPLRAPRAARRDPRSAGPTRASAEPRGRCRGRRSWSSPGGGSAPPARHARRRWSGRR